MRDDQATAAIWAALPDARIVGGAVRDTLAGRPVADIDFATALPPAEVIARLQALQIKTIPTGLAHGTVTAVIAGRGYEITTLRRDLTTDGRHATVAFTDDWAADAARRDFTINAMSADQAGTVFDYFGGRADLAAGKVRFVGDPAARITEDYLRILRFFRFHARYGGATADPVAMTAITDHAAGIARLSAERIWSELKNLLRTAAPGPAVALMQSTGVLPLVLPQTDLPRFAALLARHAPTDPLLRLAALSTEPPGSLAARLKLSHAEHDRLADLAIPTTLVPGATDLAIAQALAADPAATLIDRLWLAQTETGELRARIGTTPRPVFPLAGRDLLAAGIPPGPQIGALLNELERYWRESGCIVDARALLKRVKG